MAKKITQYPASSGNPDAGSLFDVSELVSGTYTTKKITLAQLLSYMNANLTFNTGLLKFKNLTGATIVGGSLVSISGADANAKVSKVTSKITTLSKLYVAVNPVTNNNLGDFIAEGVINNLNTNAFPVGTLLFWDSVNQTYTNTLTSGFNVFFGVVLVQSSSVGSVYASPAVYTGDLVSGSAGQVAIFQATDKVTGNSRFTFVDNIGTEIGYRISDGLNNLTQLGISYLNVETEGNSQSSVLRLANWSDGINTGLISFRKSRGTKATPTKMLAGDVIANQIFTGQADKITDSFGTITTTSTGMTTGEIIVKAMNNYVKNYNVQSDQTTSSALTQLEIRLQSSNSTAFSDFTPANTRVFAVDGDGKVYFKDYRFPASAGAVGQILITDGVGNLTWQNPPTGVSGGATNRVALWNGANSLTFSDLIQYLITGTGVNNYATLFIKSGTGVGNTEQKFYLGSYDSFTDSNSRSSQINLSTRSDNAYWTKIDLLFQSNLGAYVLNSNIIGEFTFTASGSGVVSSITTTASQDHSVSQFGTKMDFKITKDGTTTKFSSLLLDSDGRVKISNAYKLPLLDGSNGTSLITDGAGNVAWGTPSASASTSMQTIGRNSTGATLYKGTIVYISGSTGNRPNFVKAQANSEATSAGTFGVVVSDIANNADGYVCTIGTISGLDTRSTATNPFTTDTLVDGDTLYLSPTTAGYVTRVKPSAPNHIVYIGKVTLTSPTNGTIVYRIQNGYELDEIHDVAISSVANNDFLQYESATQLWKNKAITTANISENTNLYFTTARAIASVLTGFVAGAGSVSASDSILQAIQKIVGNIALKQNAITLTTTGTSGASTFDGTTLNIPNYTSSSSDNFKLSPAEFFRGLSFNNNSTTVTTSGGITASTSASVLAKSVASTNLITKTIGLSYYASVVSTGRYTGVRGSALLWYVGGGFRFTCSFNISDTAYNSGCRQFYGLQGSTADLTYTDSALVTGLLNCIGVGSDALDANLQIFTNDATGACTKIDLGSGFPANRTAGTALTSIYEVQFYNPTGEPGVYYKVVNKENGSTANGILTTDIPATTQGLNFFASRCMGSAITNTGQFILTGQFGVYSTN